MATPEPLKIVHDQFGYYVRRGNETLHGPSCQERAYAARDRIEKAGRTKTRRCMTCQTPFLSEGPHNRMCQSCRKIPAYQGEAHAFPKF